MYSLTLSHKLWSVTQYEYCQYHSNMRLDALPASDIMEVDDSKKLYELQDYDVTYNSVPFELQVRNVKIHEKSSGGGRL